MKKVISIITMLVVILAMTTVSNATITEQNAKINVGLSKTEAKVGEEITVTTSWTDKMEAVDLELRFDKTKVEFVSSSMENSNIAQGRIADGVIQVSWFSANGNGITSITYTFKVIAEGDAAFTTAEAIFADENVDSPEGYTYGSATLKAVAQGNNGGEGTPEGTPEGTEPEGTTPDPEDSKEEPKNESGDKKNESSDKKNESSSDETKKPTRIPQAGVNMINYIVYGLVAVAVVAMIVFVVRAKRK